jgi:proline iminopeptidase
MPSFAWPAVVVSGGRDLTTPPAVADRIMSLMPGAVLVRLPTAGHSVLDSRERAALQIAKAMAPGEIDALPGRPAIRVLVAAIGAASVVESVVPDIVTRLMPRVAATS